MWLHIWWGINIAGYRNKYTDTETATYTDKLAQNLIRICVGVCLCTSMNTSTQFYSTYFTGLKRKHSNRMRAARLPIVRASVATRYQYQKSSSEQVCTGLQWWAPDVTSRRGQGTWCSDVLRGHVWCWGTGGLYSEVQCIMGNGHMGIIIPLWTDRHDWNHYFLSTSLAGGNDSRDLLLFLSVKNTISV